MTTKSFCLTSDPLWLLALHLMNPEWDAVIVRTLTPSSSSKTEPEELDLNSCQCVSSALHPMSAKFKWISVTFRENSIDMYCVLDTILVSVTVRSVLRKNPCYRIHLLHTMTRLPEPGEGWGRECVNHGAGQTVRLSHHVPHLSHLELYLWWLWKFHRNIRNLSLTDYSLYQKSASFLLTSTVECNNHITMRVFHADNSTSFTRFRWVLSYIVWRGNILLSD